MKHYRTIGKVNSISLFLRVYVTYFREEILLLPVLFKELYHQHDATLGLDKSVRVRHHDRIRLSSNPPEPCLSG